MTTRPLPPILLALAALLFTAACGDDAGEGTSTSATGPTEGTVTATGTQPPTGDTTRTRTGDGTSTENGGDTSSAPATPVTPVTSVNGTSGGTADPTSSESGTPGPNTLAATLRAQASADDAEFTWLVAALEQTGLMSDLEDEEATLTLFAPTDNAFEAAASDLEYEDVPAMLADPELNLDTLLLYHVLGMTMAAEEIVSGAYSALAGGLLWLVNGETLRFNNTSITLTEAVDVETVNGLLHGIDGVLQPLPTIAGGLTRAAASEGHPIEDFAAAIDAAELSAVLNSAGPFTVFAPNNDAFPTADFAARPLAERQEILEDHIADGRFASFAVERPLLQSRNGFSAWLDIDAARINDADLDMDGIDTFYSNGVLHIVDGLLAPLSVTDALGLIGLNSLQAAIDYAALTGTFGTLANRTVFAPSDAAFDAFLDGDELTDLGTVAVESLLRFHLWEPAEPTEDGNLNTEALGELDGQSLTMSNGQSAVVDLSDGATIAGAAFNPMLLDIVLAGSNGSDRLQTVTIHVLDGVMEEP